jgi:hypothetical protein
LTKSPVRAAANDNFLLDRRWLDVLPCLFSTFSTHLHSSQFLEAARHSKDASAFTRQGKLLIPALVAVMLRGMRKSLQAGLDEVFVDLDLQAQLVRHAYARAFPRARARTQTLASRTAARAIGRRTLLQAVALIARQTFIHRSGRSKTKPRRDKQNLT